MELRAWPWAADDGDVSDQFGRDLCWRGLSCVPRADMHSPPSASGGCVVRLLVLPAQLSRRGCVLLRSWFDRSALRPRRLVRPELRVLLRRRQRSRQLRLRLPRRRGRSVLRGAVAVSVSRAFRVSSSVEQRLRCVVVGVWDVVRSGRVRQRVVRRLRRACVRLRRVCGGCCGGCGRAGYWSTGRCSRLGRSSRLPRTGGFELPVQQRVCRLRRAWPHACVSRRCSAFGFAVTFP